VDRWPTVSIQYAPHFAMRLRRLPTALISLVALATLLSACNGSPTTPTPTPTPTPSVTPTPTECSFTVSDWPSGGVDTAGGEFSVTITTTAGCAWSAVSSAPFITIVGTALGSGSGSVKFAVAANIGTSRQGVIQVANRTLTISQAAGVSGCEFSIDPAQASLGSTGGAVSVTVTRTSGTNCPWTATSNDSFITIQSGPSGTDNGSTVLAVAANSSVGRTGTAVVAGRVITISQAEAPVPCVFSVTPSTISMPSAGGNAQLAVSLTSGSINCRWTAQSNAGFITVVSPTGNPAGPGQASIQVASNTGSTRAGTLTVAGQTVTINQSGVVPNANAVAVLSYQSEPGDYIGQGLSATFTLTGPQFQIELDSSQSDLRFSLPFTGGGVWWNLWLRSASGPLAPGTYNQAARAAFAPSGTPGLDFFGSGRGCNQVVGRFLVQTAVFVGSEVQRFHARFEQHCEGFSTPLRGQIWIDAAGGSAPALADFPAPPATPITQFTFTSDPGDAVGGGQSGSIMLSGIKWVAWAHETRPAVEIGAQTASGSLTANWSFRFSAASGGRLQPGTYTGATRYPFNSGVPGLSVSGNSNGCNTLTGSFVVLEAVYGPQGEVLRFHATFEQHCNGAVPALRGEVRIVADPWR
jgi:hypothetical protein